MTTTTLASGQVYTFKISSGEEVIAKVTSADSVWIKIEHPVSVAPGPQGMGLVPSMFTGNAEEEICLNLALVSMYAVTDDSVKSKYIEATTGLRLPDKKLILG